MNRAGLNMMGAESLTNVVGKQVLDLIHPDDRERYVAGHDTASSGTAVRGEFRIVGLNGVERWVDSHSVPFDTPENGNGRRRVLSVTTDITEHKRLEQQLRQSQKMEAIGLLAGGIAHDFNNLLIPIIGYSDLVMSQLDEDDARRADLFEIWKAGERATALTRQLLAFSHRQMLQPKVLDLNALVADMHNLLRRTIPEHVAVTLECDTTVEPVRADPAQVEQVLLNLAVNAADAMPNGGELHFSTRMTDVDSAFARQQSTMTPGRYVTLTVRDTGLGMSPETQAHIFEPFFTTKEQGKGTGLGLATVYGIIRQSDGFISVTSAPGRGTTFEIYLPAVREALDANVASRATKAARGGTETLLLAEDDEAVRRLVSDVLQKSGYTVLQARDGEEALTIARSVGTDIHLLITDVVMPGLTGVGLAQQLATIRPGMRVLYSSGYSDLITKPAGLDNTVPLLAKPYLPTELLRKVRDVLDGPSNRAPRNR
jgi:PAS domain S-box-containing protein